MTKKPFGVNLTILKMLIPADYDAYARVIAEEKVALVEVAGGSPKKYMKMWHDAGVKVLHKSATIRHALKAQAAGVDLIEVVGYEASIAGGQPGDEVGNWRGELFGHPWPERKILPKVRKGYNYIWKVSPPKHPLLTV